jgi:hypothetical protein
LNEQALRQLKQRVALRCELRPMSDRETARYVAGRIAIAGGIASQVFTREAVLAPAPGLVGRATPCERHRRQTRCSVGLRAVRSRLPSQIVREVCRDFDQLNERVGQAEPADERQAPRDAGRLGAAHASAPAASAMGGPVPGSEGLFSFFTPKRKRFFSRD